MDFIGLCFSQLVDTLHFIEFKQGMWWCKNSDLSPCCGSQIPVYYAAMHLFSHFSTTRVKNYKYILERHTIKTKVCFIRILSLHLFCRWRRLKIDLIKKKVNFDIIYEPPTFPFLCSMYQTHSSEPSFLSVL